MRYVTEVNYGWVKPTMSAILSPFESTGGTVRVRDTCLRRTETVNIRTSDIDFYGLGTDIEDGSGVAVKHTAKTATLHKHILAAETRICSPLFHVSGANIVVISGGKPLQFRVGNLNIIDINVSNEMIKCLGLSGSVATRQASQCDTPFVMTLYDLLGCLCRESGRNLLTYELLRIYSPERRCETIIRLSQTARSKRFFTKMYFDVTGSLL